MAVFPLAVLHGPGSGVSSTALFPLVPLGCDRGLLFSSGLCWIKIPNLASVLLRVSTRGVSITKIAILLGLQVVVFGTAWQTCRRSCVPAQQTLLCPCPSLCAHLTRCCGLGYLRQKVLSAQYCAWQSKTVSPFVPEMYLFLLVQSLFSLTMKD